MVVGEGIEGGAAPARSYDFYSVRGARLLVSEKPAVVTAWCALLLLTLAAVVALHGARAYLLPLVAAFVLSVLLAPPVGVLERWRVPRTLAAAVAVLGVCALTYVGVALVAAPAARWVENAPEIIASVSGQLERLQSAVEQVEQISDEVGALTGDAESTEVVVQGPGLTQSLASSVGGIIVQTLFVLVMTYFFLITRADIRIKVIAAQPRLSGRLHVARVFRDVERGVAVYIATLAMVNLGVGAAVAAAMWFLGMPSPIMWGGVAAVANFIPYIGPAAMTVALAAGGLSTFDTLGQALAPPAVWIAINFIESNLVTPMMIGRRMTLNPLAVLLAVSFWTWIWGPLGGVLSIPMLIMLKVMCDHARALRPLGSFIGGPLPRHVAPPRSFRAIGANIAEWRRPPPSAIRSTIR